jgi:hypothetical protein
MDTKSSGFFGGQTEEVKTGEQIVSTVPESTKSVNPETEDIKNPLWRLDTVLNSECQRFINLVQGKLLTTVEAVARDETQREALKSLIRSTLWAEYPAMMDIVAQFSEHYEGKIIEKMMMPWGSGAVQNYFPEFHD